MIPFFKKIVTTLFIIAFLNAILFFLLSSKNGSKRHLLTKKNVKNRLFVIAGSSIGSSFDSEYVSKKLNKEVFNISFSISHDSNFILNYIEDNIKKGDIVVYGPEYDFYYKSTNSLSTNQIMSIYNNIYFFNYFSFKQKIEFLQNIPKTNILLTYRSIKKSFYPSSFTKENINTRGDYLGYNFLKKTWVPTKKSRYEKYHFNHNLNYTFKKKILETSRFIKKKGATFFITFPPIPQSQFDTRFSDDISNFYNNTNIKLIGSPLDFVLNDSLILNHPYHATKFGVKKRCDVFVQKISPYLKNIK